VAARAAASAPLAPAAAGPRTTVAPFQAVPTPGPTEHPSAPLPDVAAPAWDPPWSDEADDVPPTVVPAGQRPAEAFRAPVAPPAATPPGSPTYRDWTRPSGAGTPATTAIPDRDTARGRAGASDTQAPAPQTPAAQGPATRAPGTEAIDERLPAEEEHASAVGSPDTGERPAGRGPASGAQTGVVGGRAALRAGRQAAEDEKRRTARRTGVPHVRTPVPGMEDDEPRPPRRRAVGALVAMVVLALLVLGVYSFTSPATEEAADAGPEPTPTATAPVQTSGALPPLEVEPLPPVDDVPATPIRVPVTVLNATGVTGLAGDIADVLATDGWTTVETASYEGGDVAVTTVFYAAADDEQRQSAEQLHQVHPEVAVVAVRFFDVPDVPDPGLVVVAAGDWQP
jgi:hypothetical protein